MFEKAARCYALTLFLMCSLFLVLTVGALGILIGALAGYSSLQLLWAMMPQIFEARPFSNWEVVFGMFGGFLGAVGSAFLTARLCWASMQQSDDAEFQVLARHIAHVLRFLNRRL